MGAVHFITRANENVCIKGLFTSGLAMFDISTHVFPKVIATDDHLKHTVTLVSLGLNIAGNIWDISTQGMIMV